MRKTLLLAAAALMALPSLRAADVRLSDGSVLKGEVTQADGKVTVKTLAGDVTVAQDKVVSITQDGTASTTPSASTGSGLGGVNSPYVDDVLRRRAKYGNSDGLPRTSLIQTRQWLFTLGQLNYTGDAYLIKDGSGTTVLNASDLGSLSYGMAYANSFNDHIALEVWGDYSAVTKSYSISPSVKNDAVLSRVDIGIGPKLQMAVPLGDVEQGMHMIPNIGLTPFYAASMGKTWDGVGNSMDFSHSNLGASLNVGVDFQFGGALIALKARYLLSNDVTGGLASSNTSAWLPQVGAGFAF